MMENESHAGIHVACAGIRGTGERLPRRNGAEKLIFQLPVGHAPVTQIL